VSNRLRKWSRFRFERNEGIEVRWTTYPARTQLPPRVRCGAEMVTTHARFAPLHGTVLMNIGFDRLKLRIIER
jgi:hypothetical protein